MSINVVGCRILVKPLELEEHDNTFKSAKAAGIVILEQDERKQKINIDKGTVLQIGNKCHEDYVGNLAVGETIGFAKFGGKFIKDPSTQEELLILNDEDVICIFKD